MLFGLFNLYCFVRVTGNRHHHILLQARCSGEPRKCTAWLNNALLADDVPTKYQIKKLSTQTKANLESTIVYLCKGTISKDTCYLAIVFQGHRFVTHCDTLQSCDCFHCQTLATHLPCHATL